MHCDQRRMVGVLYLECVATYQMKEGEEAGKSFSC